MKFDLEELTLDEVEMIEDATGLAIDAVAETSSPKGKLLKAIVWVVTRRTDPSFTLEQAGKTKLTDAMASFGDDDGDDAEGND